LHLRQSLVTFDFVRREFYRLLRITNRGFRFLKVLRVDIGELEIGTRFLWLGLDRVLQDIDRARVIALLSEQKRDRRVEVLSPPIGRQALRDAV
jgi:hypothetical protein